VDHGGGGGVGAAASAKVLRWRRLAVGLDDINATRFGGKVHLRLAELHSLLGATFAQVTGGGVGAAGNGSASIHMNLRRFADITPRFLHGYRMTFT